jgi:hypothetical protein
VKSFRPSGNQFQPSSVLERKPRILRWSSWSSLWRLAVYIYIVDFRGFPNWHVWLPKASFLYLYHIPWYSYDGWYIYPHDIPLYSRYFLVNQFTNLLSKFHCFQLLLLIIIDN